MPDSNIPQDLRILPSQEAGMDAMPADDSAAFSARFVAYVIDSFPFLALCYGSLWLMIKYMGVAYSKNLEFKSLLVAIGLYVVYVTIFNSGGRVTVGKKIVGIRTVAVDGGNLSVGKAFLRAIGYFVSGLPYNLGFVAALFGKKRALHDFMAGSRVIDVRPKSDFAMGLIFSSAWCLFGLFAAAWYYTNLVQLPAKEQARVVAARTVLEQLGYYQTMHKKQFGTYTDDIRRLAAISGDVDTFKANLEKVINLDSLELGYNDKQYLFKAKVKSNRASAVQVVGPQDIAK